MFLIILSHCSDIISNISSFRFVAFSQIFLFSVSWTVYVKQIVGFLINKASGRFSPEDFEKNCERFNINAKDSFSVRRPYPRPYPFENIDRYLQPPPLSLPHRISTPPKHRHITTTTYRISVSRILLSETATAAPADIGQPSRYRLQRTLNARGMHWMQNAGVRVPTPVFSRGGPRAAIATVIDRTWSRIPVYLSPQGSFANFSRIHGFESPQQCLKASLGRAKNRNMDQKYDCLEAAWRTFSKSAPERQYKHPEYEIFFFRLKDDYSGSMKRIFPRGLSVRARQRAVSKGGIRNGRNRTVSNGVPIGTIHHQIQPGGNRFLSSLRILKREQWTLGCVVFSKLGVAARHLSRCSDCSPFSFPASNNHFQSFLCVLVYLDLVYLDRS